MRFSFVVPSQIIFGSGSAVGLASKIQELGGQAPLVVTSAGMVHRESAKAMFSVLDESLSGFQLYNEVPPEPSLDDSERCLQFARENSCDMVVGLGGGSVMDVAKKVAMDLGVHKIMLPTTAGTGSEVTHESILKVDGQKRAFVDERLLADVAIVDPDLTNSMSPRLAASSGMDALAHAIECWGSRMSNHLVKTLSLEAYKLLRDNLKRAIHGDPEARTNMCLGSLMAGMAFGNSGTALCHALSYPLSNDGIPHGEAVAIMLPYALEFNGNDPEVISDLKSLIRDLRISCQFKSDIAHMADVVMTDTRHLSNNPREVMYDDVLHIFEQVKAAFTTL